MTRIKLCGLTRPEDIAAANALQPEYIEKYSQLFAQPEILNITNGKFEVLPDTSFEQHESEEPDMSM